MLTYATTHNAGNVEPGHTQLVFVAPDVFGCTAPDPSFAVPRHGIVTVTGTASLGGRTYPFSRTVTS